MLAYYVEWHMRVRLAPMQFEDDDKQAVEARCDNPVAKAQRSSPAAIAKQTTGRTADLATIARNTVFTALAPQRRFNILTRPAQIQQSAFDLPAIPIACTQ
jgi:hypothetical protein